MKALYLQVVELLKPLEVIQFIDLDKGQIDYYEQPPLVYPAVLIKPEITRAENIGGNVQRCQARITLRIIFDYQGETTAATPEDVQADSLAYFDIVQSVYTALQGAFFEKHPFDRVGMLEELRDDGLKVVQMPFSVVYLDRSAQRL